MIKNYMLDTNILINDPQSIFNFEDNNVYIPIYVLEELDKIKGEMSSRGRNSRVVCRYIDELRMSGNLAKGVPVGEEGKLFVYVPKWEERKIISVGLDKSSMDSSILECALELKKSKPKMKTIFITMDVNLRIRAESLGLQVGSYESQSVNVDKINSGITDVEVQYGELDKFYKDGSIVLEGLFAHNECVCLKEEGTDKTALGRYCLGKIKRLRNDKEGVYGIKAKNREQTFALDMLMDPNIKLMTLMGLPGGGKSVIALASGLEQVLRGGLYSQFLIARPIVPMGGKDAIGFIPGDLDQKLRPWMQPIYDNLEFILMGAGKKNGAKNYEELIEEGIIKIEALSYVRGRTFANKFVLIDDAQNLSLLEMKTIITRCGDDTKVIITGDLDQIDNPYLDKSTCGLAIVIDKMKDNPMVGHITLTKGERSELATYAANAL